MSFPQFLIEVRERSGLDIETLAANSKVHVSTLYKAEKGTPVKWDSIRKTYGKLVKGTRENTRLLLLWAINQDRGETKLEFGDEELTVVREELTHEMDERARTIGRIMIALSDDDRNLLEDFCRLYANSESTRTLARTWTEEVSKQGKHEAGE